MTFGKMLGFEISLGLLDFWAFFAPGEAL